MEQEDFQFLYELEKNFWWFAGMREITRTLFDSVNLRAQQPEDGLILDAGCGTGDMLAWLSQYTENKNAVGIDLSKIALDFCARNGERQIAQASTTDLPFPEETFSLLTSFDVLVQVVGEKADEQAIGEMYRVLCPGGIVFVRVAAYEWMRSGHDKALNTQHRYTLGELVQKLKNAGFEPLRSTYANCFLLPAAIGRRLLLKKIGLADKGSDVKPLESEWLNRQLTKFLRAEAGLLRNGRTKLPFGLSAICIARKPE